MMESAQLGGEDRPELDRIVIALDPPASAGADSAECGIIAAGSYGEGRERRALILADYSFGPAAPEAWARKAAQAYAAHEADRLIAEANQGGDMVRAVLQASGADLPVRLVRASRGKRARAEPVAALYAAARVRHAGRFPALEDQMCAFGSPEADGLSPDRVDALVWALSDLLLSPPGAPRLRRL
jgi:phage terminase large subunit-like protein